jgi:hypothetical protein
LTKTTLFSPAKFDPSGVKCSRSWEYNDQSCGQDDQSCGQDDQSCGQDDQSCGQDDQSCAYLLFLLPGEKDQDEGGRHLSQTKYRNHFSRKRTQRTQRLFHEFSQIESLFSFPSALPAKPIAGQARLATEKNKRAMGDFLSWGRGLKVRAGDTFPKQNTGTILATKTHKKRIKTGPSDSGMRAKGIYFIRAIRVIRGYFTSPGARLSPAAATF